MGKTSNANMNKENSVNLSGLIALEKRVKSEETGLGEALLKFLVSVRE